MRVWIDRFTAPNAGPNMMNRPMRDSATSCRVSTARLFLNQARNASNLPTSRRSSQPSPPYLGKSLAKLTQWDGEEYRIERAHFIEITNHEYLTVPPDAKRRAFFCRRPFGHLALRALPN